MITSVWDHQAARRRRVYTLTRAGVKALAEKRREWRDFASGVKSIDTEASLGV